MNEYAVSVFLLSAILGVLSFLIYREGADKTSRFAFLVLLLYTVSTPLAGLIGELEGALDFSPEDFVGEEMGDDYLRVTEEAFASGVKKLIATEFSLKEESFDVHITGFEFEKMSAEKIKVILSPSCAFTDVVRLEKFVDAYGIGRCEVCFEI